MTTVTFCVSVFARNRILLRKCSCREVKRFVCRVQTLELEVTFPVFAIWKPQCDGLSLHDRGNRVLSKLEQWHWLGVEKKDLPVRRLDISVANITPRFLREIDTRCSVWKDVCRVCDNKLFWCVSSALEGSRSGSICRSLYLWPKGFISWRRICCSRLFKRYAGNFLSDQVFAFKSGSLVSERNQWRWHISAWSSEQRQLEPFLFCCRFRQIP